MEELINQFAYSDAKDMIERTSGISEDILEYYSVLIYRDTYSISAIYRLFSEYPPDKIHIKELDWEKTDDELEITCEIEMPQILVNGSYASTKNEYCLKYSDGQWYDWQYDYQMQETHASEKMVRSAIALGDYNDNIVSIEHGQRKYKIFYNLDRYEQGIEQGTIKPITEEIISKYL